VANDDQADDEILGFLRRYNGTFAELARGERADTEAMLAYYAVPATFAGPGRWEVVETAEALVAHLQAEIDRTRAVDYHHTEFVDFSARRLNEDAATVDAELLRLDRAGQEQLRLSAFFLLFRRADGWRIATIVMRTPRPG
jgi:hypothetical protein